jgi:hypothetical protein
VVPANATLGFACWVPVCFDENLRFGLCDVSKGFQTEKTGVGERLALLRRPACKAACWCKRQPARACCHKTLQSAVCLQDANVSPLIPPYRLAWTAW